MPRERLVKCGTEAVNVAAEILRLPLNTLGRNVVRRAPHLIGLRHFHVREFCQSEVEQLHAGALGDENVLRFDVTVDHLPVIRRAKRFDGLDRDLQHTPLGQRARLLDEPAERAAVQHFHHDEILTLLSAHEINLHDVRVADRGSVLRLAQEIFHELRILGKLAAENLDRHVAVQRRIKSAIHRAHPAAANFFD